MNETYLKRIYQKIEIFLLISFSVVPIILYFKNYMSYLFLSISVVIGIIIFIIFKDRFPSIDYRSNIFLSTLNKDQNIRYSIIFSIIFFIFYSLSFLEILNGFYTKTFWYYLFISLCTGIIAAEIFFTNNAMTREIILLKIILLFLNISISNQIIYTLGISGSDYPYHINILISMIEKGNMPEDYTYSSFPVQYMLIGSATIIANLGPEDLYRYLGTILMSIIPLFISMIGSSFVNIRFGLLSALFYTSSDYLIYWASHPVHMTFIYPMIFIFYTTILSIINTNNKRYYYIFIIVSLNIIFLHHYSSMISIFIFIALIIVEYMKKRYENKDYNIRSIILLQIFILMVFVHWIYYSNIFTTFIQIVEEYTTVFQKDFSSSIMTQTYYDLMPIKILVLNEIGSGMMIMMSIIGLLYFTKYSSFFGKIFSTIFIFFGILIGIGSFIDVIYLLPDRLYAFVQELSMIFLAGMAMSWILYSNKLSKITLVIFIIMLQFFSSSSTIAGQETSLFIENQPYTRLYETIYEKDAINWIMTNNDTVYINPSHPYYNNSVKTPIIKTDKRFMVDIKNISHNSNFLVSKLEIYPGFQFEKISKTEHVGSFERVKIDLASLSSLHHNRMISNIYNNGFVNAYKIY